MSGHLATWVAVVAASLLCFAIKLVGHRVPEHWLAQPRALVVPGHGHGRRSHRASWWAGAGES